MSLVRISKQLLIDVTNNINKTSSTIIAKTVDPMNPILTPEVTAALVEAAVVKVWGKYEALRTQMPAEWKINPRVDIRIQHNGVSVGGEIRIENKKFVIPRAKDVGSSYCDVVLESSEIPQEFFQAFVAYETARSAHTEKFVAVNKQVTAFLKSSASLNDALKRYPDLALYIPQTYINKVEEKVERQTRVKECRPDAPSIDRDFLTSTAVIGKLHE